MATEIQTKFLRDMKLNLALTIVVLATIVVMSFWTAMVNVSRETVSFDFTLSGSLLIISAVALLFNLGYLKQISNKIELAISASFTATGFGFLMWLGRELGVTSNRYDNNLVWLVALVCGLPPLFIGLKAITHLRGLETNTSVR